MKLIRTDHIRAGDLIVGTEASGNYPHGPRRVASIVRDPAEEQRKDGTQAFRIAWTEGSGGGSLVYYADTRVWLQQRP